MKKKLLIWSDFITPTGFGNVAKNLFSDLHLTYDVSVVAINYFGTKRYDTSKYFVYPASREDILNIKTLFSTAEQDKPDIIILFQDSFNISYVIDNLKKVTPNSKIVVYFPVDADYFSNTWQNIITLADVVITYTDWAISVLKNNISDNSIFLHKLYHGVDTNIFYPIAETDIIRIRKLIKWNNKFVITNVNRFQPRKAIPLTVRAFSMFAKGYKICKCGNWYPRHLKRCDLNGCDESNIVEEKIHNKVDTYLYLHMMGNDPTMGQGPSNSLQNHLIVAGFTEEDYGNIIGINEANIYSGAVPEETLNKIYNCSNLNISTTLGEGFGLSLIEAAATGTPTIAPNNSVIKEILKDTGTVIPNIATYSHAMDAAFVRPIIDIRQLVLGLENYYNDWKQSGVEKKLDFKCLELIQNYYLWPNIREQFHNILKKVDI